jgi:WD40 repeat protein/transcriptional regulator with XRE-family HTH domain
MTGHRQYKVTDYRFGQMILGLREKIGLTQNEVAEALAVSRRTIQHWEAGTAFPDILHLKNLIGYYFAHGGFNKGLERDEAMALWAQADESASRRKSLFDEHWFNELLRQRVSPGKPPVYPSPSEPTPSAPVPHIDWGDAPEVIQVYGRDKELAELTQSVINEQCRLVAILGMGGIGKTTLAVKFAQDHAGQFEYIIWRSLRNAPALDDLLLECLQILSPVHSSKPSIPLLLELLQQHRCLLIFDNVETLHQPGNLSGIYREGFEEYQRLFQNVAQTRHQSCVILTSRERPVDLEVIEGKEAPARLMKLTGLTSPASQALLVDKRLFGPSGSWDVFVHYYTGNPLALKIAAATVRDLFGGDLAAFLREAPVTLHTLHQLLGNQFEHLSVLERDILFWLAIERDPVALNDLRRNFLLDIPNNEILSGLLSLVQRSLIERGEQGAVFSLLPVLLEYVTDRLVNLVADQLIQHNLEAVTKYSLLKSQSIDHICDSQVRMILLPVITLLKRHFGSQSLLLSHLRQLVNEVRRLPRDAQGYAGGNLVNLITQLIGNIKAEDFSGLVLRQINLQGIEAQDSNFSRAEFIDSRFTEPLETISAMILSPSGTYLAASTYNGHIRVWNISDMKPVWTATNASRAWCLRFSPDESMLACSHFRGRVSLWDVATGRRLEMFEGHNAWVHTVAFHPDGQYLASGGLDTQILIWDLQERKIVRVLKGHTGRIWSLAFSPDGDLLVSGADEENIRVWDWKAGSQVGELHHDARGVVNVVFHPNGNWVAACCEQDPHINLWNVHTGKRFASITSRSSGPTIVDFNPDGSLLASGGRDGSVELWQVNGEDHPQYIKMLMGLRHHISIISLSDQGLLAAFSEGENIHIWNVESGKLLRVVEGYSRMVGIVAFSPDGKLLLQGDASGKIRIWDMHKQQYIASIQGHTGPIWVIACNPNGKSFATAGDDRSIRLWDIDSLNCIKTYAGFRGPIFNMAFNNEGTVIATGGVSHWIRLWDASLEGGALELGRLATHDDVWAVEFDPSGKTLVSGHMDGSVTIWDVVSGSKKATIQHSTAMPVGAIRYSSDGKTLITSSNDRLLKFWDLENYECLREIPIEAEGNRTNGVVIGKDGKFIVTGGSEPAVFLRRFNDDGTLAETVKLEGHLNRVWGVALSRDERYIASSDEEGTTLISDAQSGQVLEKIMIDRPYERMNVHRITGLNAAERAALKALGAIEAE